MRPARLTSPPRPKRTPALPALDLRSRPQKLLDGLVGACKAALATGGLPAAGGLRPQVMATIDYRDLLTRLGTTPARRHPGNPGARPDAGTHRDAAVHRPRHRLHRPQDRLRRRHHPRPARRRGPGSWTSAGPPGSSRPTSARPSPPGTGAAPSRECTIPAPWCEAHHITYWSRGGTTGTDNGTLLCSHHHHLIHKEHWSIQIRTGIPWFIPPPHIDPRPDTPTEQLLPPRPTP